MFDSFDRVLESSIIGSLNVEVSSRLFDTHVRHPRAHFNSRDIFSELDIGTSEVAMPFGPVFDGVIPIGNSFRGERLGETRHKVPLEGGCMVRSQEIILTLRIVSVDFSPIRVDVNIARPVSARNFDEDPWLQRLIFMGVGAIQKIKSKMT